jgi:hypothetical protein
MFFAQDGAPLIKPSNNRLDISPIDSSTGESTTSNSKSAVMAYLMEFSFAKDEAAPKIIEIEVPNGYSLGGGLAGEYTVMGTLKATLSTDNLLDPGQKVFFGGVLVATATSNKWALVVDYNDNVSTNGSDHTLKDDTPTRVHVVDVVPPTDDSAGKLTINFSRGAEGSTDDEENKATENWELTLLSQAAGLLTSSLLPVDLTVASDGTIASGAAAKGLSDSGKSLDTTNGFVVTTTTGATTANFITNPSSANVFRWSAEEHTTISPVVGTTEFFGSLPGSQGVVIK